MKLTIDAASLDTEHARRDKHLRSAGFFDVEHHAQARFTSNRVTADGDSLKVRGRLEAAGGKISLELDAAVGGRRQAGGRGGRERRRASSA